MIKMMMIVLMMAMTMVIKNLKMQIINWKSQTVNTKARLHLQKWQNIFTCPELLPFVQKPGMESEDLVGAVE